MKGIRSVAALAIALAAAGAWQAVPAQTRFAAGSLDAVRRLSPEQRQERRFLQETAANLRLQSEASRLALARSTNPGVREIAANILNHQGTVQPEVLHLLHVRGMALPLMGAGEAKVLKQLARLTGPRFDRLYLEEVALRSQQADAAQYEHIASVTRDPQLQAWAQRHLPTLRYHLTLAARALPGEPARLARAPRPGPASAAVVMGAGPAPLRPLEPVNASAGVMRISEPNTR